jgi:hypothetical protein
MSSGQMNRAGSESEMIIPAFPDPAAPVGPPIPRMTISLLGAKSSGKSSYVNVLYRLMASAQYGYTFSAETEVRLRDSLDVDAMIDGTKLPPTGTEPQKHRFSLGSLRGGVYTGLAEIDLIDFRGEALVDLGTDSDQLYQRIPESDSIFTVFDATNFIQPVTPERVTGVATVTMANHMADRIADALGRRSAAKAPLPSVVVLLSKVDVLDQQLTRPGRQCGEACAEIFNLVLPIAREMGGRAGFFPVSVGRYTSADEGEQLLSFEPRGVAAPLFYALFWFLTDQRVSLVQQLGDFAERRRDAGLRRDSLMRWPPLIRKLWFLRNAIARNQAELNYLRAELDAYGERISAVDRELEALQRMLGQGP